MLVVRNKAIPNDRRTQKWALASLVRFCQAEQLAYADLSAFLPSQERYLSFHATELQPVSSPADGENHRYSDSLTAQRRSQVNPGGGCCESKGTPRLWFFAAFIALLEAEATAMTTLTAAATAVSHSLISLLLSWLCSACTSALSAGFHPPMKQFYALPKPSRRVDAPFP